MNKLLYALVLLVLASCKLHEPVAAPQDPTYIRQFHSGVRNMLNEQHEAAIQDFKACLAKQPNDAQYITHFFRPTSSKIATRRRPTIPSKLPNLTLKTCIIKES